MLERKNDPKNRRKKKVDAKALVDIYFPLDDELKDSEKAKRLYKDLCYIPFYEGSDVTLKFFEKMSKLSPTHGACLSNIKDYVLGGEFTVSKKRNGVSRPNKDYSVDETQFNGYWDFVESFTSGDELMECGEDVYNNISTYGNDFLEVIRTEVDNTKYLFYKSHPADSCRYVSTEKGEMKLVLISPIWDLEYIRKNPPDIIPVYPFFTEESGNTSRTLIHTKNKSAGRQWYGDPMGIASLFFWFLDYQLGYYAVDGYFNKWIATIFFETFGDEEDEDNDGSFGDAIEDTFTQKGKNRKRVMHRNTSGDKETKIHEFSPHTEEGFHQAMKEIAEAEVYKGHKWHPVLMQSTPGSLGQSNEFREIAKNKDKTVIKPWQNKILSPLRIMFRIAEEWFGFDNPENLCIDLTSILAGLSKEERQKLTSKEVGGIVDLCIKVNEGKLDRSAAVSILVYSYKLSEEEAEAMIVEKRIEE